MIDPMERIFDGYPTDLQSVTGKFPGMIKSVMLESQESIYHGALNYALGPSVFESLVYLAMEKNYVRF